MREQCFKTWVAGRALTVRSWERPVVEGDENGRIIGVMATGTPTTTTYGDGAVLGDGNGARPRDSNVAGRDGISATATTTAGAFAPWAPSSGGLSRSI